MVAERPRGSRCGPGSTEPEPERAAHKAAVKLRAQANNRMVLACEGCPETMRSKRPPVRWTKVAAAVGVSVEKLRAAIAAEKHRTG